MEKRRVGRKAKAALLLLTVVLSMFVIHRFFNIGATSARNIDVYIVRCSDSVSSWIGNIEDVTAGVLAAVNDAQTRTKVKLAGEQINVNYLNSAAELEQKVIEAPERAVIINTHGEVLPIPADFFYNDASSLRVRETISQMPCRLMYRSVQAPSVNGETTVAGWEALLEMSRGDYTFTNLTGTLERAYHRFNLSSKNKRVTTWK